MKTEVDSSLALQILRIAAGLQGWMSRKGMDPYRIKIMYILHFCPSMTQKDISQLLGMPKQTVGHIIKELLQMGWIEMEPSLQDGRQRILTVTEAGSRHLDCMCQPLEHLEDEMQTALGIEKTKELNKLLKEYREIFINETLLNRDGRKEK